MHRGAIYDRVQEEKAQRAEPRLCSQITEPPVGASPLHVCIPATEREHGQDDYCPQKIHHRQAAPPTWRRAEREMTQVGRLEHLAGVSVAKVAGSNGQ